MLCGTGDKQTSHLSRYAAYIKGLRIPYCLANSQPLRAEIIRYSSCLRIRVMEETHAACSILFSNAPRAWARLSDPSDAPN
jgi:hypothetical protein